MKNTVKKITAFLLAAVLILAAAPMNGGQLPLFSTEASAADNLTSGQCGGKVFYTFDESTGLLTISGTGDMYNYSGNSDSPFYWNSQIKSVVIGNSVTSIGDGAFFDCTGLTSITIPNSVTSIGDRAFYDCTGLTSITIPNSVTSIGDFAFGYCTGLTSITIPNSVTSIGYWAFYACNGLTGITIPNSVTSIGDEAFGYCDGLTSITIPNSVTSIGDGAFYCCTGLTSITIPNSVTSIGDYAFKSCTGLTSITIPNSVTSIGDWAFGDCNGLTSIIVDSGNPKYDSRNNCNAIIETETNTLFTGCMNTIIPNSVTSIGDCAFDSCTGLTSITIPNSVTSIGGDAFRGCTGLTSITIPNSVTSIGDYAFGYCDGLTSITIPNSVTGIGDRAFLGCDGLTSITIPNSVTSIGDYAFFDCTGLTSIIVDSGNPNYDSRNNCNAIIETETNTLLTGCMNTIIPNSVTSIGDSAFGDCNGLTSITIPNSVTSIGDSAFYYCNGLTSITIPNSVTSIGDYAFYACTGLTSITIPNSVTSIGDYAFAYCHALKYAHIPVSVTDIGNRAFGDTSAYICSDTADCYAKQWAKKNGVEFRVCDGNHAVTAVFDPDCFDKTAHIVVSESDKSLPEFGITVKSKIETQQTYYIEAQDEKGQAVQPKDGKKVTLRFPMPKDASGKPYPIEQYSIYHFLSGGTASELYRAKNKNLRIEGDSLVIEVSHFSPFVLVVESTPIITIHGNPGTVKLHYGETLVLHADAENLPEDAGIVWTAEGNGIVSLKPSADGKTCEVTSAKTGTVKVSAKVVDADGAEIPSDGNAVETIQSKANLFWKIISLLRTFFKISMRREQGSVILK